MTPLGPRLIQPTAYTPASISSAPGATSTRPSTFGMTPARWSKGTPGIGTPLYPTERKMSPAGKVSVCPVASALNSFPGARTSRFFASFTPSTWSVPRISIGDTRKRSTMRRFRPSGFRAANSRSV